MSDETAIPTEAQHNDPTINALFKQLEQKVRVNVQIEQDLIKEYGVSPNAAIILSMRLDLLLQAVLSEEERFHFEIASADRVHDMLIQIREQVKAQKEKQDVRDRLLLPDPTVVGPLTKGGFISR